MCALLFTLALPATREQTASRRPAEKSWVYPLVGSAVSSQYGYRHHPVQHRWKHHNGLDLAAPSHAPIRSISDGTVIFADAYGGFGNLVVVRHSDEMTSHYGHCNSILVRPGQHVKSGQIVATVGETGRVTGPHLHFEVRINGEIQNPEKYIPGLGLPAAG